jgi:AraC-like DNA-binding protein
MILTPRDRHRLAFPLMATLPMPAAKSSTNAPRLRSATDAEIQFHPTPLASLDAMTAATSRPFPPHTHDQYGLGVIDAGGHVSRSDRRQVEAGPGSLIFVNPGEVHDGRAIGGQSRTWRILYFDPQLLNGLRSEIAEGDRAPLAFPFAAFQDAPLRAMLEAAYATVRGRHDLGARTACESSLLCIADRLTSLAHQRPRRAAGASPSLQRVLRLIEADPAAAGLTLERLAREAGITRYQLLRAFARQHCLPPHAYILQRRLALARRLIRGRASLAEVAVRAGFFDQSHLTHCFARHFGVTPGRYAAAVG